MVSNAVQKKKRVNFRPGKKKKRAISGEEEK